MNAKLAAALTVPADDARAEERDALLERVATMALTADVGMALNSAHDLAACLQSCAESLVAYLDTAAAFIWTVDGSGSVLELQAAAGAAARRTQAFSRIPIATSAIGGLALERRTHRTNYAIDDPRVDNQDWLQREQLRTFVGCPLVVDSRVVGVVAVFGRSPLSEVMMTAITSTTELIALGVARHQAEAARRLLAAIVAHSDDAIFGAQVDGTIMSWNAAAARLFGYAAEEIIGRDASLLCPADRRDEVEAHIATLAGGAPIVAKETLRQRKDGSLLPVSITLSPIRDAQGGVTGVSATMRDISERQTVERTLRESQDRFRLIAETVTQVFWIRDVSTRAIRYVSPAYERIWGRGCATLYADPAAFSESIHPDDRDAVRQTREIERAGGPFEHEYRIVRPDGEVRWIRDRGFPVPATDGGVTQYVGVAEDVTDRRSLEEQLRHSQKMEAIGQLAGGVAHDFNNLLTAILGFSQFLRESLEGDDEKIGDVDEIRRAAERAAMLTRQLLAFGRKQIFAVRVLHLGDVIAELTPMLRRLLGESIDLTTTIDNRGLVKADPGQLQQVLVNLAVNARDAMRDAGRLTISTSDVVLDAAFVRRHPSASIGRHVMLTVTDTGHGMNAETQKRIFEPFFTTKPLGQGTGLGLATVYGIVQQSGGAIWVDSEAERGTTFTVCLPRTEEHEELAGQPAAAAAPAGGSETILLVEDEVLVREYVYKVLSRRGYLVHAFGDPRRAIAYAAANDAPIDLVLSDVVLPDMSGPMMADEVLGCHPEARTLFMSGYADTAIVQQGVLEPGTRFLQKPFTADRIAQKVRDAIDAA
jgi:two-component system, cell cycle sensor histidine kinase and response regulator CckA